MEIFLIKAAQLILSLSILVILHEFGHFIFAKIFGARVEKFYLFFNPGFSLFKKQIGETEWGVGWLPLGGYVKISGMIDESMDKEAMKQPAQPYEFRSKPAWQRLLIMLGGVMMNFIVGFIIFIGILYVWGDQYLPNDNVKYGIYTSELAKDIGFKDGDKIVSVAGEKVEDFYKIVPNIVLKQAKTVTVNRGGTLETIHISDEQFTEMLSTKNLITPRTLFSMKVKGFAPDSPGQAAGLKIDDKIMGFDGQQFEFNDQWFSAIDKKKGETVELAVKRDGKILEIPVQLNDEGRIGIQIESMGSGLTFETNDYTFWEAIPAGINNGLNMTRDYLKQLKLIFQPETKAYKSLGGFATIGSIFPSIWNWQSFWYMTGFLSFILAIMNLLPIPALDGGHVAFLTYEIITGRKPSEKFLEYAQITGMLLLLFLLVYANGNDLFKYINGRL